MEQQSRTHFPLSVCVIYRGQDAIHLDRLAASLPPGVELVMMQTIPVLDPNIAPYTKQPTVEVFDDYTLIMSEFYYYCENPDDPWDPDYDNRFSFADAKNACLRHATRDWVLFLDSDETLAGWRTINWQSLFTLPGNVGGVYTWIFSAYIENNIGEATQNIRLFRNEPGRIYFTNRVHERLHESLDSNGYKVVPSSVLIQHFGYTEPAMEEKFRRNLYLLDRELNEGSGDTILMLRKKADTLEQLHNIWLSRREENESKIKSIYQTN